MTLSLITLDVNVLHETVKGFRWCSEGNVQVQDTGFLRLKHKGLDQEICSQSILYCGPAKGVTLLNLTTLPTILFATSIP